MRRSSVRFAPEAAYLFCICSFLAVFLLAVGGSACTYDGTRDVTGHSFFEGAVSCARMVAREQLSGLLLGGGPTSVPAHGRCNATGFRWEKSTTKINNIYFYFIYTKLYTIAFVDAKTSRYRERHNHISPAVLDLLQNYYFDETATTPPRICTREYVSHHIKSVHIGEIPFIRSERLEKSLSEVSLINTNDKVKTKQAYSNSDVLQHHAMNNSHITCAIFLISKYRSSC